jgi:hypothetical protein
MRSKATLADRKRYIEEIKAKQRNTVWPGPMINSRGVDEFLWRGSPDATLVQRMAAWIFGLTFIFGGFLWVDVAYERHWRVFGALSIVWFLVGGKVFLNGFRKRKAKATKVK